ncbi:histidine triad nucleotide-binding protein [Orrella sp. NBD-18]|uniref:Histidine triad nucleotide-binding protein n=1 Tax=Sheuella amnicola TaxID=2707330 RepID=A0A6B2QVF7_9BURK|nr:histidine triad nucleotide-binding protein [Sheuella amnicola]NDY82370.1 histidine triad nucleotide-binding protein [Sheuella amnicola]HBI84354.1 histidine triad nucleotide-binding protein [Alcaligenaceae bacterium]
MSANCIFCKIVKGDIPAKIVHQDEDCIVFQDINPSAPVHLLMIPRHHVVSMQEVGAEDHGWLGRMMAKVPAIALENGCNPGPNGGFRIVTNSGHDGGQEVHHLHFHILGGKRPWKGSMAAIA